MGHSRTTRPLPNSAGRASEGQLLQSRALLGLPSSAKSLQLTHQPPCPQSRAAAQQQHRSGTGLSSSPLINLDPPSFQVPIRLPSISSSSSPFTFPSQPRPLRRIASPFCPNCPVRFAGNPPHAPRLVCSRSSLSHSVDLGRQSCRCGAPSYRSSTQRIRDSAQALTAPVPAAAAAIRTACCTHTPSLAIPRHDNPAPQTTTKKITALAFDVHLCPSIAAGTTSLDNRPESCRWLPATLPIHPPTPYLTHTHTDPDRHPSSHPSDIARLSRRLLVQRHPYYHYPRRLPPPSTPFRSTSSCPQRHHLLASHDGPPSLLARPIGCLPPPRPAGLGSTRPIRPCT